MQDTDNPDSSTLPRPELNPLLNPILASHMGRWAEVYFTNPPERREEAILELLRELESDPAAVSNTFPPVAETVLEEAVMLADASSPRQAELIRVADSRTSPQPAKPSTACGLCGKSNPNEQLFCGACGARLSMAAPSVGEAFHPVESAPSAFSDLPGVVSPILRQIIEESSDPYSSSPVPSLGPARREPVAPRIESKLAPVHARLTSASNRRPLYVGAGVVALLFTLLLYMGWHTNAGSSGATTQEIKPSSPQPVAPASQPAPAAIQSAPQLTKKLPAANPQPASTKTRATIISATHPSSQPAPSAIQSTPQYPNEIPAAANRQPTSTKTPAAVSSATPPRIEGGAEELARAQKYLNGATGENHDSSEAAKWLWKAVSKQNVTGTLLLSDLYLRGDGVTRSCDQARVLLDAAARKGNAEAGQRLRNLHAFGCP